MSLANSSLIHYVSGKQFAGAAEVDFAMNEKILVIDDEKDILKSLDAILTRQGFQVRGALRGEDAIDIFKAEPFELVITDIRMPGMDGLEVMRQIKALDENVEVIILTGFAAFDNTIKALRDDGASDYLIKPLENIEELFVAVKRALEKRKLHIENKALLNELRQAKADLEDEIRRKNQEMSQISFELMDKRKKLDCLFEISDICHENGVVPEKKIQDIIDVIPHAFQYPEICCARVVMNDLVLETGNFKETSWKLGSDILVNGESLGVLEICYSEERPEISDNPFLKEEEQLVCLISEYMGKTIEKNIPDIFKMESSSTESGVFSLLLPSFPYSGKGGFPQREGTQTSDARDEENVLSFLQKTICSSEKPGKPLTFCRLHTEPKLLREDMWKIVEVLQEDKRKDDLLGIGKSGQVYLILEDADSDKAKATCDRLTERTESVLNGTNVYWSTTTFFNKGESERLIGEINMLEK